MRLSITVRFLTALIFAVLLGFLYLKTQPANSAHHNQFIKQIQDLKYLDYLLNEELIETRYGLQFHNTAASSTISEFATKNHELLDMLSDEYKNSSELKLKYIQFSGAVSRKIHIIDNLLLNIRVTKTMQHNFTDNGLKLLNDLESSNAPPSLSLLIIRIINYTNTYNLNADPQIKQQAKNHLNLLQSSNPFSKSNFQTKLIHFVNGANDTLNQLDNMDQHFTEYFLTPTREYLDQMTSVYMAQYEKNVYISNRYRLALYSITLLLFIYIIFILFKLGQRNFTLKNLIKENSHFLERMHIQISALEATSNGIVITNNEGIIIWVNHAFTKLTGYSEKEAIGQNPRILKSDMQPTSYYKNLWDTIISGHFWHGELINQRKDGSIYTEELTITPVPDSQGQITHFIAVKQDITERKERETALFQTNRALRVLSYTNQALLHTSDEASLITEICQLLVDLGNYRFAWVGAVQHDAGQTVKPLYAAGIGDTYLQALKISWADNEYGQGPTGIAVRTKQPCAFKNIITDARYIPWRDAALKHGYASSIALPIILQNKVWGTLNIYSAYIDAYNKAEFNLLQELANNLSFGIENIRTKAEHTNLQFQLQQAQKMESLGQLTGGIAHDFNNILSTIMGYTNLALTRFVDDKESKLADYLQEVYRAGERARDLISQMLAFSRGGRTEARPMAPMPLIKEVTKMLQATFPASIQINTFFENEIPDINFDPVQLHQIIMNLCINARDAMDNRGHISVTLKTSHYNSIYCSSCHHIFSGDYINLSVTDTGSGIDPMNLPRIFDPFYSTKDVNKGTGIGLSMVHGITHEHGGHIMVDTSSANGTTFHILFPILQLDPVQISSGHSFLEALSTQKLSAHFLIVDDNLSVSEFIAELLESYGGEVTIKQDGTHALESFKTNPDKYDLVITDQTMALMNGDELANELLKIRPELPIILCTGSSYIISENEADTTKTNIKAFISKPIDPHELLKHIITCLNISP
ncbi:MAG: ATP-binding protein [Gammaproteobacteria bacterium]|nr:ATP-binding protein [Gammaproteobacteria bacterium]